MASSENILKCRVNGAKLLVAVVCCCSLGLSAIALKG